jgi:hypothetical protein
MSFTKVCIPGKRSDPDKIYYNANVINSSRATTGSTYPPLTFGDDRQNPIVNDTADYKVSVQDFVINGGSKTLPIFIPIITDPSFNLNTTIYRVTVSVYSSGVYLSDTADIEWEPENVTTPVPPFSSTQSESEYYYCYTYSHWVKLVNKALRSAYAVVEQQAIAGGVTFGTRCPFIQYNSITGLFSIFQDSLTSIAPVGVALPVPFSTTYTAVAPYTADEYSFIGMNAPLFDLLSNFTAKYYDDIPWRAGGSFLPEYVIDMGLTNLDNTISPVGTECVGLGLKQVNSSPLIDPFTNTAISGTTFVQLTQDYSSTGSLWSPVTSIVIGTTQIPVRDEFTADPVLPGQSNLGIQNSAGGGSRRVLVEAPIDALKAELWRGYILYRPLIPTYSSMDASHVGLTNLDFQVYWRSRLTNSLVPLQTVNNGSFSIRLLFEKK